MAIDKTEIITKNCFELSYLLEGTALIVLALQFFMLYFQKNKINHLEKDLERYEIQIKLTLKTLNDIYKTPRLNLEVKRKIEILVSLLKVEVENE